MADTNQILKLAAIIREVDGDHSKGAAALAESILDHPRFRAVLVGEPTVPQGREPTSVADGEVAELVAWLRERATWCTAGDPAHKKYDRAAELLQRQVPVPASISERLPGPEDCDAEGRCWWFAPETEVDFGGWTFGTTEICANSQWVDWENTHWLPAHDLPVPEVGE